MSRPSCLWSRPRLGHITGLDRSQQALTRPAPPLAKRTKKREETSDATAAPGRSQHRPHVEAAAPGRGIGKPAAREVPDVLYQLVVVVVVVVVVVFLLLVDHQGYGGLQAFRQLWPSALVVVLVVLVVECGDDDEEEEEEVWLCEKVQAQDCDQPGQGEHRRAAPLGVIDLRRRFFLATGSPP